MSKKDDSDFEERLRKLEEEVRILHRELKAQGVDVPEMSENPSKTPLSRESLLAVKRDLAARARGAKPLGKGKGAVSSIDVKKKLLLDASLGVSEEAMRMHEAKRICREKAMRVRGAKRLAREEERKEREAKRLAQQTEREAKRLAREEERKEREAKRLAQQTERKAKLLVREVELKAKLLAKDAAFINREAKRIARQEMRNKQMKKAAKKAASGVAQAPKAKKA